MHSNIFIPEPISATFIANAITALGSEKQIGAQSIFIGQVRNDIINDNKVNAIEYSCYLEMAEPILLKLMEELKQQFNLTHVQVNHSLGMVGAGEVCLFVLTASKHRKDAIESCSDLVEKIKKEVPIWGKEIFTDNNYEWKVNN